MHLQTYSQLHCPVSKGTTLLQIGVPVASALPFHIAGWHDTILSLQRHEPRSLHPHSQTGDVDQAVLFKCWCDALLNFLVQISEVLPISSDPDFWKGDFMSWDLQAGDQAGTAQARSPHPALRSFPPEATHENAGRLSSLPKSERCLHSTNKTGM